METCVLLKFSREFLTCNGIFPKLLTLITYRFSLSKENACLCTKNEGLMNSFNCNCQQPYLVRSRLLPIRFVLLELIAELWPLLVSTDVLRFLFRRWATYLFSSGMMWSPSWSRLDRKLRGIIGDVMTTFFRSAWWLFESLPVATSIMAEPAPSIPGLQHSLSIPSAGIPSKLCLWMWASESGASSTILSNSCRPAWSPAHGA